LVPGVEIAPDDASNLLSCSNFGRFGTVRKDQVVMQMVRLPAAGWYAVNVDSDQFRARVRSQNGTGFLNDFPAGCVPDLRIDRLDMSSRKQPPIQASMKNQQQRIARGMQDQSGGGDVAGRKLIPGKWRGGVL